MATGFDRPRLVEVRGVLEEVVGALVGSLARTARQLAQGCAAAEPCGHVGGLTVEDGMEPLTYPGLGLRRALLGEGNCRSPEVLGDVDQVEHDRELHAVLKRALLEE